MKPSEDNNISAALRRGAGLSPEDDADQAARGKDIEHVREQLEKQLRHDALKSGAGMTAADLDDLIAEVVAADAVHRAGMNIDLLDLAAETAEERASRLAKEVLLIAAGDKPRPTPPVPADVAEARSKQIERRMDQWANGQEVDH